MIVYKLLRVRKDNSLGSLFINRKARIPVNKWLCAKSYPTKGYVLRPGWHCTEQPIAPHLNKTGRAWYKVEIKDYIEIKRPQSQGSKWYLAQYIKLLEKY